MVSQDRVDFEPSSSVTGAPGGAEGRFLTIARQIGTVTEPTQNQGDLMNRAELVQRLWEANEHLTRRRAEVIVAVIFDEIATALVRGHRVELRRFGAFSVRKRDAHDGRNPRTGESVAVGQKHRIHFKTGKRLHDRLQTQ